MTKTALAEAIQRKGVRQTFLAERAGISPSHLTRALRLERAINADAVAAIAEALGIDVADIFDGQRLRAPTDNCAQQAQEQAGSPKPVKDAQAATSPKTGALSAKGAV